MIARCGAPIHLAARRAKVIATSGAPPVCHARRMSTSGPRWLYMHGFASGPESHKGRALAAHFSGRHGVDLARLDGRVPSFEHLRLSAIVATIRGSIGGPSDRAVVFGSSLGGLAAARAAEEDARVCALVLLAPAFRLAERWRLRLGEEAWRAWQTTGWLEVDDHAKGGTSRVDFDFVRDAEAIDARSGPWPDVRVPTLVIHGQRDDVVDPDLSRAWAAGKRHVHLVEVDDGHELVASVPRIAAEAERFLSPFLGGGG